MTDERRTTLHALINDIAPREAVMVRGLSALILLAGQMQDHDPDAAAFLQAAALQARAPLDTLEAARAELAWLEAH